jgi:hypothetical protein
LNWELVFGLIGSSAFNSDGLDLLAKGICTRVVSFVDLHFEGISSFDHVRVDNISKFEMDALGQGTTFVDTPLDDDILVSLGSCHEFEIGRGSTTRAVEHGVFTDNCNGVVDVDLFGESDFNVTTFASASLFHGNGWSERDSVSRFLPGGLDTGGKSDGLAVNWIGREAGGIESHGGG